MTCVVGASHWTDTMPGYGSPCKRESEMDLSILDMLVRR